jgi:hypothetical protein
LGQSPPATPVLPFLAEEFAMAIAHTDRSPETHRNAGSATAPTEHISRRPVGSRVLGYGAFALMAWLLFFSAGLLIETSEYRAVLAPKATAQQAAIRSTMAADTASTSAATATVGKAKTPPSAAFSFLMSMLCFTPINLAFLSLVAGLAGGYASNIAIETMPDDELASLRHDQPRRHLFLQEPPISAAVRGFIVYLCVIAGLYLVTEDPFRDPTASQYVRLAGSLSALAFLVGYDPSRLEDWLRLIPGPGGPSGGDSGPEKAKRETDLMVASIKKEQKIVAVTSSQSPAHPLAETLEEASKLAAEKEGADPAKSQQVTQPTVLIIDPDNGAIQKSAKQKDQLNQ